MQEKYWLKTKISLISFIICSLLLIYAGSFFYPRWNQESGGERQLSYDAGGYYWYLPSVFIYHDIKGQKFHQEILDKYQPVPPNDFQYAIPQPNGNYVVRYTMGTALMELPYFLVAHIIAKPLGYPADGFSLPYQFCIYLGGLFFALVGLSYLRKLLLRYYNDITTAVVLFLLVFGTNYLDMSGINVGMSHSWLFTLYVLILFNTDNYYKTFRRKYLIVTGLLIGLAALTRPPEIIAVLIPILWGMNTISVKSIKERIALFFRYKTHFALAALYGIAVISLQFFYWKYASGHWLIYTYGQQGFSWLYPHFIVYAFNYQSGWINYTPLMLIVIFGIIPFLFLGKNKVAILSMIIVNYYIVAAWNAWDYGGRAMVQSYPVLMFPLASFIQYLFNKKWLLWLSAPVLLLFTYFNLWYTYQAHKGTLIGSVPSTKEYYWSTILRYNLPIAYQEMRDNRNFYKKEILHPVDIYFNDFSHEPQQYIEVKDSFFETEKIIISKPAPSFKWIRATADCYIAPHQKEWNVWYMTQFIIRFKKNNNIIKENFIRIQRLMNDGETKNISIDARTNNLDYDHIEIVFRNGNQGKTTCRIDNLKVIGFND